MRLSLLIAATFVAGCGTKSAPPQPRKTDPAPAVVVETEADLRPPERRDLDRYIEEIPGQGQLQAAIHTTEGVIVCELFANQAPKAVASFVGLSTGKREWIDPETDTLVRNRPFYAGVTFHRVVPGFIVQAGDRTGTGKVGPGYTFDDEHSPEARFDMPGVLALANTGANTNGSQFFITERAAPHLNQRHTIFGRCKDVSVVHRISTAPATNDGRPEQPVRIERIEISQNQPE